MNYTNEDKQLLLNNGAATLCRINLLDSNGDVITTFSESDYITEIKLEDFRYVPDVGVIGQFVERLLNGKLSNLPLNIDLVDKEISLEIGVKAANSSQVNYYDYGNFIITDVSREDTTGVYTFKTSDYAKKFNKIFNGEREYPCLALHILNMASSQVGIYLNSNGYAVGYAVGEDGLPAGNYYFEVTIGGVTTYYNFTTASDLLHGDSLLLPIESGKVIQKKLDSNFVPTRTNITPTTSTSTHTGTLLSNELLNYIDITNNDFVIDNNQFVENNSCRDVVKAIAQLSYTWARIDELNHLRLDFTKKSTSDVDQYDIIDTNKYFTSKITGDTVPPVNKVLIGMSTVDGENVYKTSQSYTPETESAIYIYDNPLTYNDRLRRIAINGAESLFNLTYTPMEIDSIAHPWLTGKELIKINNLDGQTLYTYPFNRTINYKGIISTKLASQSKSVVNQKYEWKDSVMDKLKKTSIEVDKATGNITLLTQETQDIKTNVENNYYTKENVNTLVQNAATGVTNTFSEAGGNNIFHNSGLWFLNEDDTTSATSPYEFWTGYVIRGNNEKASNRHSLILQQGTLTQEQVVPNGNYTISFKYKKLLPLSVVKCIINGVEYELTEDSDTDFLQTIVVNSQEVQVDFTSTMDNACEIYDIMVNAGTVKLAYSQNQNETVTDTVNISKGITITSSVENTTFKANTDGVRIFNNSNMHEPKTKFTEDGTETDELIVKEQSQIVGILRQRVGDQIWDCMM